MVAAICATPIKGTMMRIVKVDACGVPVTGSSSLVVITKGFIQVVMDPQYEEGEEFVERTADGTLCVNQKDDPILKRMALTMQFCEIDPVAASYMLSARQLDVTGGPTGAGMAMKEGQPTNRFSLEVWQKVAGSGACDASGVQRYIYNAWPNIGSIKLGGYTIENGRSVLELSGETGAASTLWGTGPGTGTKWMPNAIQSTEHWAWFITTTAPPAAGACGSSTL